MSNDYPSPDDPGDHASMRGGSCMTCGVNCRSAVGYENTKDVLGRCLGFRLALRRVGRAPGPDEKKYRE